MTRPPNCRRCGKPKSKGHICPNPPKIFIRKTCPVCRKRYTDSKRIMEALGMEWVGICYFCDSIKAWTTIDGDLFGATFIEVNQGYLVLRLPSGIIIKMASIEFCTADQEWARKAFRRKKPQHDLAAIPQPEKYYKRIEVEEDNRPLVATVGAEFNCETTSERRGIFRKGEVKQKLPDGIRLEVDQMNKLNNDDERISKKEREELKRSTPLIYFLLKHPNLVFPPEMRNATFEEVKKWINDHT